MLQNLGVGKKETTQSIAVSEEENFVFRVLAKAHGIKPATAARQIVFRGLSDFIGDRKLQGDQLDSEIYDELVELIRKDDKLARAAEAVRAELSEKRKIKTTPQVGKKGSRR